MYNDLATDCREIYEGFRKLFGRFQHLLCSFGDKFTIEVILLLDAFVSFFLSYYNKTQKSKIYESMKIATKSSLFLTIHKTTL